MTRKKQIILLSIIGLLIVITLALTITYSYVKPFAESNHETNVQIAACAKIQLKDNEKSITIKNTYPMSDELGLENTPYEFTVNNTCDSFVGFNLYLSSLESNLISDSDVKFALKDMDDQKIVATGKIGELTPTTEEEFTESEHHEIELNVGQVKNIYKVYSIKLPYYEDVHYALYIWIDKDASNEVMQQTYTLGVSLKAYEREKDTFLSDYLINTNDGNLLHHNSELIYGANDDSYRYSGASENVNNYVCLDGTTTEGPCQTNNALFRIIGIFKNEESQKYEIKLISSDYLTDEAMGTGGARNSFTYNNFKYNGSLTSIPAYSWNPNNSNNWTVSSLNTQNLNTDFYNYITNKNSYLSKHIAMHDWIIGGNSIENLIDGYAKDTFKYEITQPSTVSVYNNHIGLMYISDYVYAANQSSWENQIVKDYSKENNWLYLGLSEWTLTKNSLSSTQSFFIIDNHVSYAVTYAYSTARPCFYLTSNTVYKSGSGSSDSPYRIGL